MDEVLVNILSGDYLFNTPSDSPSAYYAALTAGFGLLFVVSALAYWRRGRLAPDNPVRRRFIRRVSKVGMWCGGVGLFLALMRYLEVPYLGIPFWMLLLIVSMILVVAYFVYEWSERYPLAVWQLQENTLARRYRPPPKVRSEPQRPRPKMRGKRRR